jgi:hypothetical protein
MGTRGSFPGGKAAGAWSWPLTSILCRVQRMSGAIPPLPHYAFMAWCSVKVQGQLHLLVLCIVPSLLLAFSCLRKFCVNQWRFKYSWFSVKLCNQGEMRLWLFEMKARKGKSCHGASCRCRRYCSVSFTRDGHVWSRKEISTCLFWVITLYYGRWLQPALPLDALTSSVM